jgi:hypothetical protein
MVRDGDLVAIFNSIHRVMIEGVKRRLVSVDSVAPFWHRLRLAIRYAEADHQLISVVRKSRTSSGVIPLQRR